LDVVAEFTAMESAVEDCRDWIVANLPTDADGYLVIRTLNADGTLTDRMFAPAQTAGLRTEIDAVLATID
jgi:hypothetical protein